MPRCAHFGWCLQVPGPSGESYIALFPLNVTFSDLRFHKLRDKGGFLLSAGLNSTSGRLDGPVTVESEVGGKCALQLPPAEHRTALHVTDSAGTAVPVQQTGLLWTFATRAGETYTATVVT